MAGGDGCSALPQREPSGHRSHLPLPSPALQEPPRDCRDSSKLAPETPKLVLLVSTYGAPGPCVWDALGWIHWEQVGVALEKELEMPPDHHSPPEAAQQVHTDLAVNLHHSNPLHSSGLHVAAKPGPKQTPAPGHPSGTSCPSSCPSAPNQPGLAHFQG